MFTLYEVLQHQAQHAASTALLAPHRNPLSYGELLRCVDEARAALRMHGIEQGDRVALVLANGPELATAFLGVATCATAAPLNPSYRADEFAFYLSDLSPKAIIVERGSDTTAREVAESLGIATLELEARTDAAGCFVSSGQAELVPQTSPACAPTDTALVLHTSGTTSRPKIVPLTHTNLVSSAFNMKAWYALEPCDRCLSIMPLFHIQGLVGGLLASLAAGGSIVCAPPFEADAFFQWLHDFQPTWYTAGPTFHRAIVQRAHAHPEIIAKSRLRFIRSSSAPLPVSTLAQLELMFGAPVLEGYGMTETTLHTTSNPLPPAERIPGSVGMTSAADVDVSIMALDGAFLPTGQRGEIVVRGPTVMRGYLENPEANERAFFGSWHRTGDEGYLDSRGYLTITGRIKEIINRGGEKVSPAEVDAVLLKHSDVTDAASFPVPHATLGEDVWAAVVLRDGASADENALRAFVADHVADFKVPRRILLVERIPKSHLGKLQRGSLAAKLGLIDRAKIKPRDAIEARICEIWKRVLERSDVWINDSFFEMGGDSLADVVMFAELESEFGVALHSDWWWLSEPTIEQLAKQVRNLIGEPPTQ